MADADTPRSPPSSPPSPVDHQGQASTSSPPPATDAPIIADPEATSATDDNDDNNDAATAAAAASRAQAMANLLPSPPSTPLPRGSAPTTSVTIVDERNPPPSSSAAPSNDQATADAAGSESGYRSSSGATTRIYTFPQRLPERSGNQQRQRVVTVRDLKNKSCWICSEEDDEEDEPTSNVARQGSTRGDSPTRRGAGRRRRFVHPCNCTLVAHESCLLAWIDQSKLNHPTTDTVTCPQCKAPYILLDTSPLLLRLFERTDKLLTRLVPIGCFSLVGGSILIVSAAYGCAALRLVLGKDAAQRLLASPWPWHFWFDIPVIPFALVASKLRIAESATTWIPTVLLYSLNRIPVSATQWRLLDLGVGVGPARLRGRSFPPSPTVLALLIPWVRQSYLLLKRRVYRAVLGPFIRKRRSERRNAAAQAGTGGAAPTAATTARRQRVIVVGDEDNYLEDATDPTTTATGLQDALNDDDDYDDRDAGGGGGGGGTRTIILSRRFFGRLVLDALSLPLVASVMGKLLAVLAQRSGWLARVLGMSPPVYLADRGGRATGGKGDILSSFYTSRTGSTSASSSSASPSPSPSPISALFRGHHPQLDDPTTTSTRSTRIDQDPSFRRRLGLAPTTTTTTRFDDLDPVWWRNALGAALFIVVKDGASLLHKWMKLRQRRETRVVDLPFGRGLVEGLELREQS